MHDKRTVIIAEAGVNHNGSVDMAIELARTAARAGADVVKYQSFRAEEVTSAHAKKASYQERATGAAETQLEMLRGLQLDAEAEVKIADECKRLGIEYMSTPSDTKSADRLVKRINVARIKIGSGELTNSPLLLHVSRLGRPIILSTGMSTLADVKQALATIAFGLAGGSNAEIGERAFLDAYENAMRSGALRNFVTLLHCTTEYPAPVRSLNLNAMATLRDAFGLRVGFSDHSTGIHIAPAAVAMGACMIEKHFTLDRKLPGPDHGASLELEDFSHMVSAIRDVEQALGSAEKKPDEVELGNKAIARRSLVAAATIRKGETFTETNLTMKRPGTGISPIHYWAYLGKTAVRDYSEDELIDQ